MRSKRSAVGHFHGSSLRSSSATATATATATAARPIPSPVRDNVSNSNDSSADSMEFHRSSDSDFSGNEKMNDDDFDENTCLECDRGDDKLLICCGIDCRIALHEMCMSGEPKYDEEGKFYCPYCWYKLVRARTEELRKKVVLAKECVVSFLSFRPLEACGDKEKQNSERAKGDGPNVGRNIGESNECERVSSMDVDDGVQNGACEVEEDHEGISNEKLPGEEVDRCEKISVTHSSEIVEDEVCMEHGKDDREDDDEKDEGTNADEDRVETLTAQCVAEKTVVHGSFQRSPGVEPENSYTSERVRVSKEREEQVNNGAATVNASCTRVDRALKDPEVVDSETENSVVHLRHVKRIKSQNVDSPEKSAFHSPTRSTIAARKPVEEVERAYTLNTQFVAEKTVLDGTLQGSPAEISETLSISGQNQASMEKEEQMNKDAPTANMSCTSVDGALNGLEVPHSEAESSAVRLRHVKQMKSKNAESPTKLTFHSHIREIRSPIATSKPVEEVAPLKNPKKPELPANKFINLPFAHEKRKRVLWKPEEEEVLTEGVHKYSMIVNKNLPWRKILEYGRHIFDPSRSAADLKDKWRSVTAKNS